MEQVSVGIAFFAGILSFLSPCIFPLVPGYISFLSGISLEEIENRKNYKKVLMDSGITSIFFVLGFSLVFISLGASATFLGKLLIKYRWVLTKAAGIMIILFGLHLIGLLRMNFINYHRKFHVKHITGEFFSAFLVGIAFGFGWSPCVGPILASILALAAREDTLYKGMFLLGIYSLGIGIPFILSGFAVGWFMKFFERYRKFIRTGEILTGCLLIFIGVLIFNDSLDILLRYLPPVFYKFLT